MDVEGQESDGGLGGRGLDSRGHGLMNLSLLSQ